MPQAFGGLTGGGDLAATSLAGMGGAAGGGSALGDTGYQGGTRVAGGAADYAGEEGREAGGGLHDGSAALQSRLLWQKGLAVRSCMLLV